MRVPFHWAVALALSAFACACGDDDETPDKDTTPDPGEQPGNTRPDAGRDGGGGGAGSDDESGSFTVLTYNVAGLPEGLSQSMPLRFTPMIGPKLNAYELVLLQESWQTPEVNPLAPLRAYHEILVATADHPYKTVPATQPFGNDPTRPSALLGDGLNVFSRFPLGDTTRVAWSTCVDTASDCLAFKGFSLTPAELADGVELHVYNLHMEAGGSAEDDQARALGLEQMIAFMEENSKDAALLVGGDFNLHTDEEPAKGQFEKLQLATMLADVCTKLGCDDPGRIDKVLLRSSAELELRAEEWRSEGDVFVSDMDEPLSDHLPVAARVAWTVR
jgi:endonuclease/exonuclease/phosphatase family metal-dependent hydrolase